MRLFVTQSISFNPSSIFQRQFLFRGSMFYSPRLICEFKFGPNSKKMFRIYESKPKKFSDFSQYFCYSQKTNIKIQSAIDDVLGFFLTHISLASFL